jgi:hypothetical protein
VDIEDGVDLNLSDLRHQEIRLTLTRHPSQCKPVSTHQTMDIILSEIAFALARAAVATLLSRELYSVTVPGLVLFSITVYAVITRDPLRDSLPPYMDFSGTSDVLSGQRRKDKETREVVRISVLGRDAFWVSKENVMDGLIGSRDVMPVYCGKGILVAAGDKEQNAIAKVSRDMISS